MAKVYRFFKPYGVLCSFTDPEGRPTLKNYIQIPGIYSAGRLDFDSEGLLLLTHDGGLIHRLTDPRFNHPKTYWVQCEGLVDQSAIDQLSDGVIIKNQMTRTSQVTPIPEPDLPDRGKQITPHGPTSWLEMTLFEGRKRQIRHMTAAVGFPALRIIRIAIGPIRLEGLKPGEVQPLSDNDLEALVEFINGDSRNHFGKHGSFSAKYS